MDIMYILGIFIIFNIQIEIGISQVQLNTNGAITAVLGNNSYQLTCTHSGLTTSQIQGLSMSLKKDSLFIMVLSPIFVGDNASINSTFSGRISVDRFTADNPITTVTFQSIECGDEGTYSWEGSYFMAASGQTRVSQTQNITVKALPVFGPHISQLFYTPNTNIAEGDKVTFTCSGDVGNNPVGEIAWFYYKNGESKPIDESSNAVSAVPQVSRICSRSMSSTLELTLTRNMDNMVVRCTVQQDTRTPEGDGHIQTDTVISVMQKTTSTSFNATMSDSTSSHNEGEGTTSGTQPGFRVGMVVGVVVGAFAVGAVGISLMLVGRCYKHRKVSAKPTNTNTELNTRSEDSIAEINNYDHAEKQK